MKKNQLVAFLFCASLFFLSCTKNGNNDEGKLSKCRLIKTTQGLNPDTDTIFMFKYNSDGLLSQMSEEGDMGTTFWWDFVYKPGKTEIEKIWLDLETDFNYLTFEYNAQGKPSKISSHLGHEFTYQYNTSGQLSRVDSKRFGTPDESYLIPTYDNNGNLVKTERKWTRNDEVFDTDEIEYSDLPNTLSGLSTLNLGNALGMNALFRTSYWIPFPPKYLIKSAKNNPGNPGNTTYSYTYEKDAANNVIKAVVQRQYNGNTPPSANVLTWNFEYDCDDK